MINDIVNGYAICFNEWALDKNIKNELGLLLIISSLCAKEGYCYATNKYLSSLFDEPVQTISRKIKILEEKGIINITYKKSGNVVTDREIRLTKMLTAVNKNVNGAVNKNVKENNINISSNINITRLSNNINLNNINIKEIYKEIIEYLNHKAGTNYRVNSSTNEKLISARLKDGYTLEDFKTVIDKKCAEWVNDSRMCKYLRPSTLFNATKFEEYLGQKVRINDAIHNNQSFKEILRRGVLRWQRVNLVFGIVTYVKHTTKILMKIKCWYGMTFLEIMI